MSPSPYRRRDAITLRERDLLATLSRYQLQGVIATGGFGTVFRAYDRARERGAALKVLHPYLVASTDAMVRFAREAQAVRALTHPNVVAIYDVGLLPDGRPYFAMDLLSGKNLEQRLADEGLFSAEAALEILDPLASALSAAHAQRIVHRDVKASNVFLDEREGKSRVKLLDFGVAKILDHPGTESLTSRQRVGTPSCMAPEQIDGRPVDARTDVYGLGILAYHMLTGQPPFVGSSASTTCYLHVHAPRPRPSHRAMVPPAIDDVVTRAMQQDPAGRFASAAEFVVAFRRALGREPLSVRTGEATCPALAVYLELGVPSAPLGEIADGLEDTLDLHFARVRTRLAELGFECLMEVSGAALYLRLLADAGDEDAETRPSLEQAVTSLAGELAQLGDRAPFIQARLYMKAGEVTISDGEVHGGELVTPASWVPHTLPLM